MRALLTILLIFGLGCGKLYIPPIPPEYTVGTCEMNPPDYRDMAASTVDIDAVGEIPNDPSEALAYCTKVITDRGWILADKPVLDESSRFARFTTTGPTELPVVLLGYGFKERPVDQKAGIMCHEAVHTFQYERLGTMRMAAIYAINEGTFAIEVPAYRMTFRVWVTQNPNTTHAQREEKAADIIANLYDNYGLTNMPRDCAITNGVAILMSDL